LKFKCKKETNYQIINEAYGFTSTKSIETILQNLLIKAEDNKVFFKTSNIITGYSAYILLNPHKSGETTVSCKKLLDIIREFPTNSEITFDFDGSRLNLTADNSHFTMSTLTPSDFPTMANIVPEYYIKIGGDIFLNLLKKVYFCIASESSKISYNGAHLKVLGNKIQLSSSDFQRIAICETTIDNNLSDEFIINIPKRTVGELIKILNDSPIEIETDRKQVVFKFDNKIVYSNLIENYIKSLSKLFEVESKITVKMKTNDIYEKLKRISTITSEINYGVVFSIHKNYINIASLETEYGKGSEVVSEVEKTGEDIDILFNAKLFLEILAHIECEYFYLHIVGQKNPVIIEPINDSSKYLMVTITIETY
jgi:DNA polymerase-3 subunit beta